ncbi:MAG: CbtB domain-containing protein [Methylococcales bacterium]
MSSNSGLLESSTSGSTFWQDKILPALIVCIFAGILLFSTGFAEMSVLHNAAHDSRHSSGFPCH